MGVTFKVPVPGKKVLIGRPEMDNIKEGGVTTVPTEKVTGYSFFVFSTFYYFFGFPPTHGYPPGD